MVGWRSRSLVSCGTARRVEEEVAAQGEGEEEESDGEGEVLS